MSFNSASITGVRIWSAILCGTLAVYAAGCSSASKEKRLSQGDRAMIHLSIANGAIVEGDPTGALIELKKAEELGNDSPQLHHLRALAYYQKHDVASAIEHVRKSVKIDPSYSDGNNTLGKLLMDSGKFAEAEGYLTRAARDPLYRDSYKAMTTLGIGYYRAGDLKKARGHLTDAVKAGGPMSCVAHYYLGNVKMKESDVLGALDEYDRSVVNFCGKFPEGHFAKGVALMKSGRHDDARKQFLQVNRLFPGTAIAKKAMDQLRYLP